MTTDDFYCYICGKPIGNKFVLFSMSPRTDRVFLNHEDCAKQIDDRDKYIAKVKRR